MHIYVFTDKNKLRMNMSFFYLLNVILNIFFNLGCDIMQLKISFNEFKMNSYLTDLDDDRQILL